MKKIIIAAMMVVMPSLGFAAGGNVHLDHVDIDLKDKESLRAGAKLFTQYCYSCHSLEHMRFNRMAQDLEISEEELEQVYMLTTDKPGDHMKVAMTKSDAKQWFGTKIPDLTLVARVRGADWLYTYLRTFYKDDSRPFGVNNVVFPDVGMPHVLYELQGLQEAVIEEVDGVKKVKSLEPGTEGSMTADEYDNAIRNMVNFLVYAGEPVQVERKQLGIWVILFLVVFTVLAYLLKKEYWKDVH